LHSSGRASRSKEDGLFGTRQISLASNIFDFGDVTSLSDDDRKDLFRSAFDNVEFFLNSIFKSDVTSQQTTVLKFLVQALAAIPNATIYTLREMMEESGYARHKDHFGLLDWTVQRWLSNDLYQKKFSVTVMP